MPQILCVACFKAVFQLEYSNALLVILISDYGLLLEKTITDSSPLFPCSSGTTASVFPKLAKTFNTVFNWGLVLSVSILAMTGWLTQLSSSSFF